MKKLLSLLIFVIYFTSCSKNLEENPKGQLVGNEALKTVPGLQTALLGAYQPLKNGYTSGFGTAAIVAVVMGSDDLTTHPASNKQELREMDQFAVSNTNGRLSVIWLGCYKSIKNTNNIIANYKNTIGDQTKINQIAGEAYFLRAFSYYWLVRLWNNIPVITSADYSTTLLSVAKSAPAEVYKLIESDLKQAEILLPNTKPQPGRPNAGSAKALLADVYLTQGGYPINDNTKYALAAAKAKEVIDNKALYGFDLVPDLATLWSGKESSIGTKEGVFELEFAVSGNANSVYGKSCMPTDEGGWDDYYSEITFFNNFPAGKRKNVTFHTTINSSTGPIPWQNGSTKHPYYEKFRVNTPTPGSLVSNSSLSIPLIRYAHVLLIYAEAQARADGLPNIAAYTALNQIRDRAGLSILNSMPTSDFINAVVNERAWEFAGEYTRWFDLVRLQLIETANSVKNTDDLKPLNAITKANYFLPIPNVDLGLNPNLK
jgi:hypothetical protein